jgi:hypothetical protein
MEDNKTGFQLCLERAAVKVAWGILVTTMALPTAWKWAVAIDPDGILGVTIALGFLGSVALTPLMLGCGFASDDLRKARRIWRASRPSRSRNHRIG